MSETLRGSTPQSEFTLTTTLDDEQECACEGCSNDVDDQLTLLLGCDIRGTLADYGTVGFCSVECARQFVAAGPYQSLDEDMIIFSEVQPVVATVVHKGAAVETTLGFDIETAVEDAAEIVGDLVERLDLSPDELTIETESL